MKIESISLDRCKQLECRALHQTSKGVWWCGARLMSSLECIHPDNKSEDSAQSNKNGVNFES